MTIAHRLVAAFLCLFIVGCAEASWSIPPIVTPQSDDNIAAWLGQVHEALDAWQTVLPCNVPMALGEGGMPVVLMADAAWLSRGLGEITAGHFYKDDEIVYVRGSTANDRVGIVAHELGHAMGWTEHSKDPTSIMYYYGDGTNRPTVSDGAMLASIVGCR